MAFPCLLHKSYGVKLTVSENTQWSLITSLSISCLLFWFPVLTPAHEHKGSCTHVMAASPGQHFIKGWWRENRINNVDVKSPSPPLPTSHDCPCGSFEFQLVLGIRERDLVLSHHFVWTAQSAAPLVNLHIDHPNYCYLGPRPAVCSSLVYLMGSQVLREDDDLAIQVSRLVKGV